MSAAIDVNVLIAEPDLVKAELSKRKLRHFIEQAWHVVEPKQQFIPNWHIDAICDHLEAITFGDIRNLVINISPRCMKSLIVSVMWPVWSWINDPASRWLYSSYAQTLATRDAVKSRRIIDSTWFSSMQPLWGTNIRLTSDQNQKQRYENLDAGYRVATSVSGMSTGEGGDVIVCDDPHNIREAESDVVREGVLRWWDEVMTTRLNNPSTGAKVIIMQRTHHEDLAGHVLEKDKYEHLCLPMRYESDRHCSTSIGFEDPRTTDGELMWPERIDADTDEDIEEEIGSYAYTGQFSQNPTPRKGGMFPVDLLKIIDEYPDTWKVEASYRYWDKAGTKDAGCFTAGAKVSRVLVPEWNRRVYVVEHMVRGQWAALEREETILRTAQGDGRRVKIAVEQEPGSAGKDGANATIVNLAGYRVIADRPTGDKEDRADPFACQVQASNVFLLRGEWNKAYKQELAKFPASKYKDQVDATSGAFNMIFKRKHTFHVA